LERLKIRGRLMLGRLLKFFKRRKSEDFRRFPVAESPPLEDFFRPSPPAEEDFFRSAATAIRATASSGG
jgi:hypothetical protein